MGSLHLGNDQGQSQLNRIYYLLQLTLTYFFYFKMYVVVGLFFSFLWLWGIECNKLGKIA